MTAPARLDRALVQALRDGSLAENEREWLANQLDAAVEKLATAVAALGLERSRQEQSAQIAAREPRGKRFCEKRAHVCRALRPL
jgi:hypothetical protein